MLLFTICRISLSQRFISAQLVSPAQQTNLTMEQAVSFPIKFKGTLPSNWHGEEHLLQKSSEELKNESRLPNNTSMWPKWHIMQIQIDAFDFIGKKNKSIMFHTWRLLVRKHHMAPYACLLEPKIYLWKARIEIQMSLFSFIKENQFFLQVYYRNEPFESRICFCSNQMFKTFYF